MAVQQTHKSAHYIVFDDHCKGVKGISYMKSIKYYIKREGTNYFDLGSDKVLKTEAERVGYSVYKIPEFLGEYSGK